MSIIVNGTEIDTIIVNGVEMDTVIANGSEVYTKTTEVEYYEIDMHDGTTVDSDIIRIENNATIEGLNNYEIELDCTSGDNYKGIIFKDFTYLNATIVPGENRSIQYGVCTKDATDITTLISDGTERISCADLTLSNEIINIELSCDPDYDLYIGLNDFTVPSAGESVIISFLNDGTLRGRRAY